MAARSLRYAACGRGGRRGRPVRESRAQSSLLLYRYEFELYPNCTNVSRYNFDPVRHIRSRCDRRRRVAERASDHGCRRAGRARRRTRTSRNAKRPAAGPDRYLAGLPESAESLRDRVPRESAGPRVPRTPSPSALRNHLKVQNQASAPVGCQGFAMACATAHPASSVRGWSQAQGGP